MARVFIGLGSNLEHPKEQLSRAFAELAELPQTRVLAKSSLYSSRAVGPVQPDYTNAVAELETSLAPLVLLDHLQALEQAHRRVRLEHWGPRTLDLDILLIDNQQIASERLTVPHPYMTQRNFVIQPLAELAPDLQLPGGDSIRQLSQSLGWDGLQLASEEF